MYLQIRYRSYYHTQMSLSVKLVYFFDIDSREPRFTLVNQPERTIRSETGQYRNRILSGVRYLGKFISARILQIYTP